MQANRTRSTPDARALLAPFFPGWRGDASEPALPPRRPSKPPPPAAANRELTFA